MIPAELAEEALIWEWQEELEMFGPPDAPARPVKEWADEWILKLDFLPDDLLDISLNARILADTGIPLKKLSADASWDRALERFANSTLLLIADSPLNTTRYFMLLDPVVCSDEFPQAARDQYNSVLYEVIQHVSPEMDTLFFQKLLHLWAHGAE